VPASLKRNLIDVEEGTVVVELELIVAEEVFLHFSSASTNFQALKNIQVSWGNFKS
jgi:hypothetical protein